MQIQSLEHQFKTQTVQWGEGIGIGVYQMRHLPYSSTNTILFSLQILPRLPLSTAELLAVPCNKRNKAKALLPTPRF